uniref:Protein MCM10 homolog n=1 Tax=Acrobeloides nanus TaxID=290746 RepID=A0A914ECA0_9BILA
MFGDDKNNADELSDDDSYYTACEDDVNKENSTLHETLSNDIVENCKTPTQEPRVRLVPLDFENTSQETEKDNEQSLVNVFNDNLSSSEDEFERNHDDRPALNETGRRLKKLLEQSRSLSAATQSPTLSVSQSLPFPTSNVHLFQSSATQTTPDSTLHTRAMTAGSKIQQATTKSEIYDITFGISVRKPRIELKTFNTYCMNFRKFKLTQLYPGKPPQGEWVTMGVIVDKTEQRKSANNNDYMIWHLHDLSNCQLPTVKVLLFGECLKEHWKLQPGMVVAITQAQFGEPAKEKNEVTLKLTKAVQVVDLGFCPDFGHCKGMKNDGTPCSMFVNTAKSTHCAYHVRQSAQKLAVRRGAFNTSYSQPPKNLDISAPRAFAQQPGLFTVNHTALNQNTVPTSSNVRSVPSKGISNPTEIKQEEKKQLDNLLHSNSSLLGARNLLKMKTKSIPSSSEKPISAASLPASKSMKDFISNQFQEKSQPQTSSQSKNSAVVDLSKPNLALSQKEKLARQRAVSVLQKSGSNGRQRKRPIALSADFTEEQIPTTSAALSNTQPVKKSRLGGGFTDDQIQKLLEKKSTHEKEANEEDRRREEQYFTGMEVQEKVETHMSNLMEIKNVKVVT